MMRIINRIYNWFRNIILNIMGVIMDMNNNEVEITKVKCEMAKYIIEKGIDGTKYIIEKGIDGTKYIIEKGIDGTKYVFGSRKTRFILAVALALSCVNIPEDKEVTDNERCKF